MKNFTRLKKGWLIGLLVLLTTATYAQKSDKVKASEGKITVDLLRIQQEGTGTPATSSSKAKGVVNQNQFLRIEDNRILIEAIVVDGQDASTLLAQLQALGLTEGISEKRMVSGLLPIDKIDDLKNLSALRFARPSYEPIHNIGATTSQGDRAMKADVARQLNNVTGSGSKIGVLSDSYNAKGGAATGVASGDLPANVQVIDDFLMSTATDEGRAMIELIHDIAPGANVAFNTANRGQAGFAKGIRDLAAAGCNVIVDDVIYFAEPFFQDGIIAQAVDEVKATRNVTYFSSAGNNARNSYQSTYSEATPFAGPFANDPYIGAHNFGGGDIRHSVAVPARSSIRLGLQWDNPFASVSGGAGAQTDMDLLVYRNGAFQQSLSGFSNNLGGDPLELVTLTNTGTASATFELIIAHYAGPAPTLVKWVAFTNGQSIAFEYPTRSSTCFGHANAAGAIATGAADYRRTPVYNGASTATLEGFSSAGGTPILFNVAGQRIATVNRQKPEITAVDGTNTTFFSSDSDGDGFPNFFGTSAAAPHAAAVAALLQQFNRNQLSPDRIVSLLEQTALDMDDPATTGFDTGFDTGTGYGFIQADRALAASNTAPTVANAIPAQSGRVGQAFSYVIPANTFDDLQTPTSLTLSVSGLPPGLTFTAPATISGTPLTATGSPFTVTVTATDPGGLSVSTTFLFTIEGPVTPLLTVLHRDVDNYADNNAIQPLLVLQNNSSIALPYSALTLRYYVTVENASALTNLFVNYAQIGNQNVQLRYVPLSPAQQGAQGYVEVSFAAGAGNLAAGTESGPIQAYFAKGDYGSLNELDDYSYATVRNQLVANSRITAYYNGVLIAGIEPGTTSAPPTASGQILRALTESKNGPSSTQINTYLEIRNEGNTAVNYSDLKARYYFSADGNERLQVEVDEGNVSAQLVKLNQPVNGADYYLEISYLQGGQLAPGASTGTVRYRISKPDGGRFDQTNDYSYQEQPADRSQNSRVVVYVAGTRVWGNEPTSGAARIASAEPTTGLTVTVLGNPVRNDVVSLQIRGAGAEPLRFQLVSAQGQVITQRQVANPQAVEQHNLSLAGQTPGIFLLQVSTPTQSRIIRVLKAE
ncbi:cellulose binding domain-containing protein [uncultured Fibrella sp.]|uniref:cellulose binding domain-containing protein n=1 Tax=uncultured Fibrella sp. TaxID=1284596 RepID=UPI0035C9853B